MAPHLSLHSAQTLTAQVMNDGTKTADNVAPPSMPSREQAGTGSQRFIDDYLSYLLSHAAHLVARAFHAHVESLGFSVPVWRVLATLSDGDGLPVGELARITLYKQPTLTRIIDRLETDGIVRRAADSEDRRRVLIHITDKGRSLVARLLQDAKDHESMILQGYSDAEIALLKQALRTLIDRSQ